MAFRLRLRFRLSERALHNCINICEFCTIYTCLCTGSPVSDFCIYLAIPRIRLYYFVRLQSATSTSNPGMLTTTFTLPVRQLPLALPVSILGDSYFQKASTPAFSRPSSSLPKRRDDYGKFHWQRFHLHELYNFLTEAKNIPTR